MVSFWFSKSFGIWLQLKLLAVISYLKVLVCTTAWVSEDSVSSWDLTRVFTITSILHFDKG